MFFRFFQAVAKAGNIKNLIFFCPDRKKPPAGRAALFRMKSTGISPACPGEKRGNHSRSSRASRAPMGSSCTSRLFRIWRPNTPVK